VSIRREAVRSGGISPAERRIRKASPRNEEFAMSATKIYLLSVHMVEGQEPPSEQAMQTMYADVDRFNKKLQAEGAWVFAGGLLPADVATVVHAQPDGTVLTTDGPFAETKEHLGGFWVVKAPDLDAALALAAEGSKACQAPVEVRPFQDDTAEL
jgi:hypothetical protein